MLELGRVPGFILGRLDEGPPTLMVTGFDVECIVAVRRDEVAVEFVGRAVVDVVADFAVLVRTTGAEVEELFWTGMGW